VLASSMHALGGFYSAAPLIVFSSTTFFFNTYTYITFASTVSW
jgi:hypothetical protein